MFNRRTLIITVAACALSASVAGAAAAMPDHIDGPATSTEVELFQQRAASPETAPVAVVGAREVSAFQTRAHRFATERDPGQDALDREYELSGYVRVSAGTTAPQWFDALMVRSDQLNRTLGLGAYADLAN